MIEVAALSWVAPVAGFAVVLLPICYRFSGPLWGRIDFLAEAVLDGGLASVAIGPPSRALGAAVLSTYGQVAGTLGAAWVAICGCVLLRITFAAAPAPSRTSPLARGAWRAVSG